MQFSFWLFVASALLPQLARASASTGTCGRVLLQSHQALTNLSVEEPSADTSAPQAAGWLGWGRWVAKEDFWHMQGLHGENLFTRHMPDSCFKVGNCRHHSFSKSEHFESVETWSSYYSSSFGQSMGAGFGGLSASIDASMGLTQSSSGRVSKRLAYAMKTAQRKCYRLIRDMHCAYNKSNLQPALFERIAALPKDGNFSVGNMEAWKASFIQRFGTHITTSSSHGALVQSLSSVDTYSEVSNVCLDTSLSEKFGWTAVDANVNVSSKRSQCSNTSKASSLVRSTCVAVGGDPRLQPKICLANVTEHTFDSWLHGGDLNAASSLHHFTFLPMGDFLKNVDFAYHAAAQMLEKAVEYSNCRVKENPPVQSWDGSRCQCVRQCPAGYRLDPSSCTCKCARQCANGGQLDLHTCTCRCRGNTRHGFKGPDCTKSYGSCQAGRGTRNWGAAERCSKQGKCSSWFRSNQCKATDVCCATKFGTRCCPFGYSCRCSYRTCGCVAP